MRTLRMAETRRSSRRRSLAWSLSPAPLLSLVGRDGGGRGEGKARPEILGERSVRGKSGRMGRTTLGDVEELLRMNVLHPAGVVLSLTKGEAVLGRRRGLFREILWEGKVLGLVAREGHLGALGLPKLSRPGGLPQPARDFYGEYCQYLVRHHVTGTGLLFPV